MLRAALGWAVCLGSVLTIRTRHDETRESRCPLGVLRFINKII